ncbi:MAG: hypothetical protein FWF67_06885 [Fibromonadales bacterium]|nr:hypothetical protein [Fibromonadales bacterium]
MKTLVKFLLSLPGMDSAKISAGLKVPPLLVLSTEYEQEATKMLDTLEKYGAVCELENTEEVHKHKHEHEHAQTATSKKNSGSSKLFLILIMFVLLFVFVISYFFSYNKYEINIGQIQLEAENFITNPTGWIGSTINDPAGLLNRVIVEDSTVQRDKDEAMSAQMNRDLKKALVKNPYNDSVWKILYEKLEREGDSAGAKSARESHARAVKAQQVLLNLARGLGDEVRVEIKDNAVHYYINKELTDSEFYAEAVKLKKNLNSRFPGKDLILDNYASKNKTQSVIMKAE